MKTCVPKNRERGLTLIEVFVVTVVLSILVLLFMGVPNQGGKTHGLRIQCVNNLKQTGLAFRIWAEDQTSTFPMQLSTTNGGTMEFTTGLNAYRHFQVMSNELSTPKVLFCPT